MTADLELDVWHFQLRRPQNTSNTQTKKHNLKYPTDILHAEIGEKRKCFEQIQCKVLKSKGRWIMFSHVTANVKSILKSNSSFAQALHRQQPLLFFIDLVKNLNSLSD